MVFPSARGKNMVCNEINPIPLHQEIPMSDTTSAPAPAEKSFGREVTEQSTLALATTAAAFVGMVGGLAVVNAFIERREAKKLAKEPQAEKA
jgi:hypothetical protein